jgi:hypothetical protein
MTEIFIQNLKSQGDIYEYYLIIPKILVLMTIPVGGV